MTTLAAPSGGSVISEPAAVTAMVPAGEPMLQHETPERDSTNSSGNDANGGDTLLMNSNTTKHDDESDDESEHENAHHDDDNESLVLLASAPPSVDGMTDAQTASSLPDDNDGDVDNINSDMSMDVATPPTSAIDATNPLGAETDGFGMKGYLSMRDEGLTYHRMKRFYCRCAGVNFSRFATRDTASALITATFSAEIDKVESWDGKGLWHTYRNSFKLYFTTGAVFNVDADSEDDKRTWLAYIRTALRAVADANATWHAHAAERPDGTQLSLGGLAFADKKHARPAPFQHVPMCAHPRCGLRFDSAKRQHHCRNCGGSMCSDHSARFAALRHVGLHDSVRVCVGCYRVQRLVVWLAMLVQRVSVAQLDAAGNSSVGSSNGIKKPTASDDDEIDAVVATLSDAAIGISDVIQVLHLHRHGCDDAYARAIAKLLDLAPSNLVDFEFFLPQLFQLWLTVDYARNTVKAALLFRVVCVAAQLHIRFATAIYWLTRAAVDDACGWGFGQSELLVPDYLFRKFSLCKLMIVNLEMQLAPSTPSTKTHHWRFHADRDVPATEHQKQVLTALFDRLDVLVRLSPHTPPASPLGTICDALTMSTVPLELLHLHAGRNAPLAIPSRSLDAAFEWRVFETQVAFVEALCDLTERLRHCAPSDRKAALRRELETLAVPDDAFSPIGSCDVPLQRLLTIARNEGTVFTTRARAPTLVFFEVEVLTFAAGRSHWMQAATVAPAIAHNDSARPSDSASALVNAVNAAPTTASGATHASIAVSMNAIEVATSSDIGQALELKTLSDADGALSSAVASKADEDKHAIVSLNGSRANMLDEDELDPDELEEARDRVASNPPAALAAPAAAGATTGPAATTKAAKLRRKRSGSLVTTTTKSLDSILSACSETLSGSNRRQRSASLSEVHEPRASSAHRNALFNDVEKFTPDQLRRMARSLEASMVADAPASHGVFTGRDVVTWMARNELVFDEAHALWLGGELMASGAIERAPSSTTTAAAGSSADAAAMTATTQFTADASVLYRVHHRESTTTLHPKSSRGSTTAFIETTKQSPVGSSSFAIASPSSSLQSQQRKSHAVDCSSTHKRDVAAAASSARSSQASSPTASNDELLQRQSSAYNADTSNVSTSGDLDDDLDDQQSVSATPSRTSGIGDSGGSRSSKAFMEKFKPDDALSALQAVEDALEQHVFAASNPDSASGDDGSVTKLRTDLATLKEQVEIVYTYVRDKRRQHLLAKESAFGESFDETRARLREASRHVGQFPASPIHWDCVAFIVKSNDDLRQEVLCLQLIRQVQDIFISAELPLRLLPYGIIATSASTGMIEFVKDATSLDALKKRRGYTTLAAHFVKTYGDVESPAYKTAMTNFVSSMAAYSLVCYILQIKDRHNGNIMLDSDGHVVHIDFGFILGIAPGGRFSLETAPFKLTAEMVDAMGGTQSEYFKAYVIFLIQGFLALQQHADTLLLMIAIMAQESSCPCFLSQQPRDILSTTKRLFQLQMDQPRVIKHVLQLVRRSHNSYRTRQYDVFQRMTNGILP